MKITQDLTPYNATLGARLKALRLAQGVSFEYVAASVDISHFTVRRIEAGHGCHAATAARLARLLGVSTDYLFGLTDDPTPAAGAPAAAVSG